MTEQSLLIRVLTTASDGGCLPFIANCEPHPLHEKLYGSEKPDADIIASIESVGILQPIVINKDRQILSGTRRWKAAKILADRDIRCSGGQCGVGQIPAQYVNLSELEQEQFIIHANRQRTKTPEQKSREFTELKRIEAALAKQRQAKAGKMKGKANLPEASKGQARDKAADAVGLKPRTAEKLEKVVKAADAGDTNAREALDEVNAGKKSVDAASNEIGPRALLRKQRHAEVIALYPDLSTASKSELDRAVVQMYRDRGVPLEYATAQLPPPESQKTPTEKLEALGEWFAGIRPEGFFMRIAKVPPSTTLTEQDHYDLVLPAITGAMVQKIGELYKSEIPEEEELCRRTNLVGAPTTFVEKSSSGKNWILGVWSVERDAEHEGYSKIGKTKSLSAGLAIELPPDSIAPPAEAAPAPEVGQ